MKKIISKRNNQSGFTLLEIITALIVIAVAFLPLMRMYTSALEQIEQTSNLTTAKYIAKAAMEKMKNMAVSEGRLLGLKNPIEPPLGEPPYTLNGREWRVEKVVRRTMEGSIKVTVKVYLIRKQVSDDDKGFLKSKPVIGISTLIEDYEIN